MSNINLTILWKIKIHSEFEAYIGGNYYKIDFTLDEIRPNYEFNETCQNTVPQAFAAFFEADGFEDTIRNAISVGGDSDTLAAIAGSIAEAFYGVPLHLRERAESYLNTNRYTMIYDWLKKFEEKFP